MEINLQITDQMMPNPMVTTLLPNLCKFIPTCKIIPTQFVFSASFRLPQIRAWVKFFTIPLKFKKKRKKKKGQSILEIDYMFY